MFAVYHPEYGYSTETEMWVNREGQMWISGYFDYDTYVNLPASEMSLVKILD